MQSYKNLSAIVEPLLSWYEQNHRSLPWRDDPTPYHVWLSEIMLQQTRIEAVIPYYERFLAACPTVKALADIDDEALMKLWEGLGYYSRARNLKKAAVAIMQQPHRASRGISRFRPRCNATRKKNRPFCLSDNRERTPRRNKARTYPCCVLRYSGYR